MFLTTQIGGPFKNTKAKGGPYNNTRWSVKNNKIKSGPYNTNRWFLQNKYVVLQNNGVLTHFTWPYLSNKSCRKNRFEMCRNIGNFYFSLLVVTGVLQGCNRPVTRVLMVCYRGVTWGNNSYNVVTGYILVICRYFLRDTYN